MDRNRWIVLFLGLALAACGDNGGGGGNGGSGASGGGGGAGGGGGSGGAGGSGGGQSLPVCDAATQAAGKNSFPWFGFEDKTPDLANGAGAIVEAVDMGGMNLKFDVDGSSARFAWEGPSLAEVFSPGDEVTAKAEGFSFSVGGAKGQAVVMRFANQDKLEVLPPIPAGGPTLAPSADCVYEEQKACPNPDKITLYSITATLGAESATMQAGKTGQVGAWKVYHPKTSYIELYAAMGCTSEKFFDGMVQALEVKP